MRRQDITNYLPFSDMQIFSELAKIGPVLEGEVEEVSSRSPWFNTEPHPGLRAYPFLSQVCHVFIACMPSLQVLKEDFAKSVICTLALHAQQLARILGLLSK